MGKVVARLAGVFAAVAVLLGLLAGPAQAVETPSPAERTSQGSVAVDPPGETRAVVVGALAFGVMIVAAGGVFWYTARHRQSSE
ncbi:hypothetical protein GCM10027445_14280 [Amycolatopsis endophytica]|uniref:Putative membrane protein YedE/YeeE n=1 Tax=Amycolatopsis endophytica TaxID=860233 RepID=A0A853B412_9PSEU|nr:hypothetical protein [Amycolatopsis endophytica]NYI89565.1 putative membrane protein YedE/YeeE [Amycolatopsis endophytica]